jgi:hypothetical protein
VKDFPFIVPKGKETIEVTFMKNLQMSGSIIVCPFSIFLEKCNVCWPDKFIRSIYSDVSLHGCGAIGKDPGNF